MTIRIVRNSNGNCVQFIGSSQPAYWNACLSGAINQEDNDRVDIINDIRTTDSNSPHFEFFGIHYTEFTDQDGNSFADAVECAAYITEKANVVTGGAIEFGPTDLLDLHRDSSNTSLLFSTGHNYAVHSIHAHLQADGLISILEQGSGGTALMINIRHDNVTIGGDLPASSNTATAVVNALNSLFSVVPLGVGGYDAQPSYTYIDAPTNFVTFGDVAVNGNFAELTEAVHPYNSGLYTTDLLVNPGDFFEFNWNGIGVNAYGKNFVIGFVESNRALTEFTESSDNMGNLDMAVRAFGMAAEENHDYGVVIERGFNDDPMAKDHLRLGLDDERRLYISAYDEEARVWQTVIRSAFPTDAEEYRVVGLIFEDSKRLIITTDGFRYHEVTNAMQARYIESPDGVFHYPLFSASLDADAWDAFQGGTGQHTTQVWPDELPSVTQWKAPVTGYNADMSAAPVDTDFIRYTAISTAADSLFAPPAFSIAPTLVNENTNVNILIENDPTADWSVAVTGLPAGLVFSGGYINGTAPNIEGYKTLDPRQIVVTVAGGMFYLDGVAQDTINLEEGMAYRFDQSDASNAGHPLRLATNSDGTHNGGSEYTTGVTSGGVPGNPGAYTQITPETDADNLYYYCSNHTGMGGQALTVPHDPAYTPVDIETHTITITKTNLYGVTTNSFDLYIRNTTPPPTSVTGFTWEDNSLPLAASNELDLTSVVKLDTTLTTNKRLVIPKWWVSEVILLGFRYPDLHQEDSKLRIGIKRTDAMTDAAETDWSGPHAASDFALGFEWEWTIPSGNFATSAHRSKIIGGDDAVFSNWGNAEFDNIHVGSVSNPVYDFAFELDSDNGQVHAIACNINNIYSEPSIADGGQFSRTATTSLLDGSTELTLYMQADFVDWNGNPATMEFSETVTAWDGNDYELHTIDLPAPAALTSFTSGVQLTNYDESLSMPGTGSNGHRMKNPIGMYAANQTHTTAPASGMTTTTPDSRPWHMNMVFKTPATSVGGGNEHVLWSLRNTPTSNGIDMRMNSANRLLLTWGEPVLFQSNPGTTNYYNISQMNTGSSTSIQPDSWYGIFMDCNGLRFPAGTTEAQFRSAVRIYIWDFTNDSWLGYTGANYLGSAYGTGGDMRSKAGGSINRYYDGKVMVGNAPWSTSNDPVHWRAPIASFCTGTYKLGAPTMNFAEMEMYIKDPMQWFSSYLMGTSSRDPMYDNDPDQISMQLGSWQAARNQQIWLMGDGAGVTYPYIYNQVDTASGYNDTALSMDNMTAGNAVNITVPNT